MIFVLREIKIFYELINNKYGLWEQTFVFLFFIFYFLVDDPPDHHYSFSILLL